MRITFRFYFKEVTPFMAMFVADDYSALKNVSATVLKT